MSKTDKLKQRIEELEEEVERLKRRLDDREPLDVRGDEWIYPKEDRRIPFPARWTGLNCC